MISFANFAIGRNIAGERDRERARVILAWAAIHDFRPDVALHIYAFCFSSNIPGWSVRKVSAFVSLWRWSCPASLQGTLPGPMQMGVDPELRSAGV